MIEDYAGKRINSAVEENFLAGKRYLNNIGNPKTTR